MPSHPQTSPALFISVASGDPRSLSHSRRTHLSRITLSEAIGPVMKERPKSNLVLVALGGAVQLCFTSAEVHGKRVHDASIFRLRCAFATFTDRIIPLRYGVRSSICLRARMEATGLTM